MKAPDPPVVPALEAALEEYRAAANGRYRLNDVGWQDEHRRREQRFCDAINALLAAALEPGAAPVVGIAHPHEEKDLKDARVDGSTHVPPTGSTAKTS